ncbi:MAG: hypothetical protein Q9194_003439 [Teloschistes cf. exilis]
MKTVLFRIQRELRHSNGKQYWGGLFSSILVLAIEIERLEFEVRCQEATDKEEGVIRQDDRTADDAIVSMDEQLIFLQNLFTQKYRIFSPKGLNPLLNSQIRASLDHETQAFATSADEIVRDYSKLYGDGIEVLYDKLTREIGLFLEAREPPCVHHPQRPSGRLRELLDGSVHESNLVHIRIAFEEPMEQIHPSIQGRDVWGTAPIHCGPGTQQHIHGFNRCPVLGHARERSVQVRIEPQLRIRAVRVLASRALPRYLEMKLARRALLIADGAEGAIGVIYISRLAGIGDGHDHRGLCTN